MTDDANTRPTSTGPPQVRPAGAKHRRSIDVYTVEGMGAALARLRRETGLTQTQFGEMVGASRPWVSDLERGNLRGGQLDTALACIHALGYRIVLAGIDTKPSVLDDLKNSMRRGPLARRPAGCVAPIGSADEDSPSPAVATRSGQHQPESCRVAAGNEYDS